MIMRFKSVSRSVTKTNKIEQEMNFSNQKNESMKSKALAFDKLRMVDKYLYFFLLNHGRSIP